MRGSLVETALASDCIVETAGSMWTVWNAPATLRGTILVRCGGFAASSASCSAVPPATTWPEPLSLAAVSPYFSSAAITSSRSPPITADIDVGQEALAAAIALPRSRTSTIAASTLMTLVPAAAVISPTLWPATTPTLRNASDGDGSSSSTAVRPAATRRG